MDTIARENNSYLPVAGVIVGVLALVLSGVALAKVSSAKKELSDQISSQVTKLDEADGKAANALAEAENSKKSLSKLAGDTQSAFTQVATEIGGLRGDMSKLQEASKARPVVAAPGVKGAAAGKPGAAEAGAEPKEGGAKGKGAAKSEVGAAGTYIVRKADTLAKIAKANGVSLSKLQEANPGVESSKLKVGQKIKLPAK